MYLYYENYFFPNEKEKALLQLAKWSKENPEDWDRICNPETYCPTVEYISELVEKLYEERLLTLIYIIMCRNWMVREVTWAIDRTVNECFTDVPMTALVYRFRQNLRYLAERSKK